MPGPFAAEVLKLDPAEAFKPDVVEEHMSEALERLGVTIAVDDFGTGYSSLRQLRELPFDREAIEGRDDPGDRGDLLEHRDLPAVPSGLVADVEDVVRGDRTDRTRV